VRTNQHFSDWAPILVTLSIPHIHNHKIVTTSPSVSPRSATPTSPFSDHDFHSRSQEPTSDIGRESPMSDIENKLPSLQTILADIPPSVMKTKSAYAQPSPVDQEMSKLINKFLVFENKPSKALEVTFASPIDVHYPPPR
jgi:hypothetical protein